MTKSPDVAVEWLIDTVKEALEDGRATVEDLEEWLLAAILLDEISVDEQYERLEERMFASRAGTARTLH